MERSRTKTPRKRKRLDTPTGSPGSGAGRPRRAIGLLAILATALGLRLLHVAALRGAPFYGLFFGDAAFFEAWAREIAGGDWIGHGVFFQAPLYPYLLGTLHAVFGPDPLAFLIPQALLGSLGCVLLADATSRFFSRPAGLLSGFLLACYPPAIYYGGLLHKPVLTLFLSCLLLWSMSRCTQASAPAAWAGSGAVLALLTLTRQNTMALAAPLLLWAFAAAGGRTRARVARTAWLVLGLVAMLAPVAVRNQVVGGELRITTSNLGANLYIGNNPASDGSYVPLRERRGDARVEELDSIELAEQALGRKLAPDEASRYWVGRTLEYVRTQPADWSRLMVRKVALLWNAAEIPDSDDFDGHASASPLLRWLGRGFHFGVLAPLAFVGLWVTWGERRRLWPLYLMIAVYGASVVVFFVFGRYRLPLAVMLVPFAAAGMVELRAFLRRARATDVLACAGLTLAVAVGCNLELVDPARFRATFHYNVGIALAERGRLGEAAEQYEQALAWVPGSDLVHKQLARTWIQLGDYERAEPHLLRALAISPDFVAARYWLGVVRVQQQRWQEADAEFSRVLLLEPDHPGARRGLEIARSQSATPAVAETLDREED